MEIKVYDKSECITYFQSKYAHLKPQDIGLLYDMAIDQYINLKYPFRDNLSDSLINESLKHHPTWCLRRIEEMIQMDGLNNLVGYSENGVSWKFGKEGISQSLIDEIVGEAFIGEV